MGNDKNTFYLEKVTRHFDGYGNRIPLRILAKQLLKSKTLDLDAVSMDFLIYNLRKVSFLVSTKVEIWIDVTTETAVIGVRRPENLDLVKFLLGPLYKEDEAVKRTKMKVEDYDIC
jgi:hypothetical protein